MTEPYPQFETAPGDKPIAYVLVGLPGSGKSGWAKNHPQQLPIASTDIFIEAYAEEHDLSYAEAFKAHYDDARGAMRARVTELRESGADFIWDQVNLTREERVKIHALLDPTHRVVYVCFMVPLAECLRRHAERDREGGAVVDEKRIRMLAETTQFPRAGEEPFYKCIALKHPDWGRKK